MESAEKPIQDLHKKVSGYLKQTPQSVNPNDESALEPIKRDFQHLVGSNLESGFGGASNSVNDRDTKGRIATLIGKLRRMKKAA